MARYRTTLRADEDIIDLFLYGALEFGDHQAESYHQSLVKTFELLCVNPEMAREHAEFTPKVRIHPHGAHLIIYKTQDNGDILIIRVLHGRVRLEDYLSKNI